MNKNEQPSLQASVILRGSIQVHYLTMNTSISHCVITHHFFHLLTKNFSLSLS